MGSFTHSLQYSLILLVLLPAGIPLQAAEKRPQRVDFTRDIRPILADNCFQCHGPDKARRKADLRLDTREGLFADLGDVQIVAPGKLKQSELFHRIITREKSRRMPPRKTKRTLTPRQITLIRQWIEQGAPWQQHWAFVPPRRPTVPSVKHQDRVRNPIDTFVLANLEREGMRPAPQANRTTLLRRVTLDLTGLPPTPEEIQAFLADTSSNAYEKVVDRLLASPAYGERMAIRWLDAARYADTNGYQSDGGRTMWRWRDYVLDAYNTNMPFDRFTIEQLAGDLLPNATLEQHIATGFNRNHRGNGEGGVIAEEYAVEYVVDRVETTATVWMGLTLGCARCHDHKYDPFTQKEFYRLFDFFNNVPESGKAVKFGNSPPMIKAPTPAQQQQLQLLDDRLTQARDAYQRLAPRIARAQKAWERKGDPTTLADWSPERALAAHFPLDGSTSQARRKKQVLPYTKGILGQAAEFSGQRSLPVGDVGNFGYFDKFTLSAWVYPQGSEGGTILSRMTDEPRGDGYSVVLRKGKVEVNLVKRWLDDSVRVQTQRTLTPGRWYHLAVSYDGSRVAEGIRVFVDGRPEELHINLDELNQSFKNKAPFRIGGGHGPQGRFHGKVDEVRIYTDVLDTNEVRILSCAQTLRTIHATPAGNRSPVQALKLRTYFLEKHAPKAIRKVRTHLLQLERQRQKLIETFPTTMVMKELPKPRSTHVLQRGQYDKPGEKVTAGVPARLPEFPKGVPLNRLGLARWLVSPAHPLTARVAVNRYWQMYFGTGLVKTTEDFGTQGDPPSHPQLLDWLATEFIRSGWNVKHMQRLIVTSATYRQSSRITPELQERDPDNRLLARGPRFRLSAETIRDQALALSGLLVKQVGGPSVKPYQPAGLWEEVSGTKYQPARGQGLYRRSLYTFWKRTVSPPVMSTFDAPARETCIVRRSRTNTPLQALTLMNDVTFVEAARVLAERVMREGGKTPKERLHYLFRLATARSPSPSELRILLGGWHRHRAHYQKAPGAARALLSAGTFPRTTSLDASEHAAYTALASLVLNLDEVITKE